MTTHTDRMEAATHRPMETPMARTREGREVISTWATAATITMATRTTMASSSNTTTEVATEGATTKEATKEAVAINKTHTTPVAATTKVGSTLVVVTRGSVGTGSATIGAASVTEEAEAAL